MTQGTPELDLEKVLCRFSDLTEGTARGFTLGGGDWPLRGVLVRVGSRVYGYVNRCPHAGHPLNLKPHGFLTPDGALILCSSHGALFEKSTGYCVAGPCAGRSLRSLPVEVTAGFVLYAGERGEPGVVPDPPREAE